MKTEKRKSKSDKKDTVFNVDIPQIRRDHQNEQFNCYQCDKNFALSSSLARHTTRMHKNPKSTSSTVKTETSNKSSKKYIPNLSDESDDNHSSKIVFFCILCKMGLYQKIEAYDHLGEF